MKTIILFKTLKEEFPAFYSFIEKYMLPVMNTAADYHYNIYRDVYDCEKALKNYKLEFYTTAYKYEITATERSLSCYFWMRKCYAGEDTIRQGTLYEGRFSIENFTDLLSKVVQNETVKLGAREIFN